MKFADMCNEQKEEEKRHDAWITTASVSKDLLPPTYVRWLSDFTKQEIQLLIWLLHEELKTRGKNDER